jgi:HEAT repeat protein
LTNDEDHIVRHYAVDALATAGKEAVPHLITILRQHPDEDYRRSAARSLSQMGRNAKEAVPALMSATWQNGGYFSTEMTDLLVSLGAESKPFLSEFLCALEHDESRVRWDAIRALVKLRPWVPDAVERISEQLSSEDESDVDAAIQALGEIGREAKAAIPRIRRIMMEEEPSRRFNAAVAHWRIQPEDHVYSVMRESMACAAVSTDAAVWVWKIGRDEKALQILADRYMYQPGGFGCGLGAMGWYRGYLPAVEAIQESLNDRQKHVRELARQALDEIRPTHDP